VRAWTDYWLEVIDRLIDQRRRWHEASPARHSGRHPALRTGAWLLAIAALLERILGG
jgi:hypothetical protein